MGNEIEKKIRLVGETDGVDRLLVTVKELSAVIADMKKKQAVATDAGLVNAYAVAIGQASTQVKELKTGIDANIAAREKEEAALRKYLLLMEERARKQAEIEAAKEQNKIAKQLERDEAALAKYIRKLEERRQKEAEIQAQTFTGQNVELGSIDALTQKLSHLTAEMNKVKVGSNAFLELEKKVGLAQLGLDNAHKSMSGIASRMNSARMSVMNFNRVIQDSPYFLHSTAMGVMAIGNNLDPLAQTLVQLKEKTGSWKGALKDLVGGFSGTSGLLSVISLAVSAFTAYSIWAGKSKESTDKLKESASELKSVLDGLIQVENPFEKLFFPIKSGDLQKAINSVWDLRKQSNANIRSLEIAGNAPKILEDEKKRLEILKGINDKLSEQKKEALILEEAFNALTDAGLKAEERQKEKVKALKEEKELIPHLVLLYEDYIELLTKVATIQAFGNKPRPIKEMTGWLLKPVESIPTIEPLKESRESLEKMMREEKWLISDFAESFGDALAQSGMDAFRKMFGEANSLLEYFIESFFNRFANRTADSASDWFYDTVTTVLPFMLGKSGGEQSPVVINSPVYIDGREIAKSQVKYIRGTVEDAQRKRY